MALTCYFQEKLFGACFQRAPWFAVTSLSEYGSLHDALTFCREARIDLREVCSMWLGFLKQLWSP